MTISINGIAHIQLTVNDPDACVPFWEKLCHFMEMKTLLRNEESMYCIGGRTGVLVRGAPINKRGKAFDQDTGEVLWEINLGSPVRGFPITYSVDGRQYVVASTGSGNSGLTPELRPSSGNNIFVFALPDGMN